MSQIIELLKNINYQVSKELLFNYKKLNITDSELIVLIYLINQSNNSLFLFVLLFLNCFLLFSTSSLVLIPFLPHS